MDDLKVPISEMEYLLSDNHKRRSRAKERSLFKVGIGLAPWLNQGMGLIKQKD